MMYHTIKQSLTTIPRYTMFFRSVHDVLVYTQRSTQFIQLYPRCAYVYLVHPSIVSKFCPVFQVHSVMSMMCLYISNVLYSSVHVSTSRSIHDVLIYLRICSYVHDVLIYLMIPSVPSSQIHPVHPVHPVMSKMLLDIPNVPSMMCLYIPSTSQYSVHAKMCFIHCSYDSPCSFIHSV